MHVCLRREQNSPAGLVSLGLHSHISAVILLLRTSPKCDCVSWSRNIGLTVSGLASEVRKLYGLPPERPVVTTPRILG